MLPRMSGMRIRRGAPTDVDKLCAIARRTIPASYGPFLGNGLVAEFIESDACDRHVRDNMENCSVIAIDGDIAGFCICKDDAIDLLMIDRAFQRKGAGTRLLKHCERSLFRTYSTLRLDSFEENADANHFYLKNGWAEAEVYCDDDSGHRKITFVKQRPAA